MAVGGNVETRSFTNFVAVGDLYVSGTLTTSGSIALGFAVVDGDSDLILSSSATSIVRASGNFWTDSLNAGIRTIVFSDSPHTVSLQEYTVLGDCTSGVVTASLPNALTCQGRIYNFKKIDSSANNYCIKGNGVQNIDGSPLLAISTQYANRTIQASGSGWYIL